VRHLAKMAGWFGGRRVGTTRRPWLTGALLVVVVGMVASGCDWSLFGYDAANTRNSADTGISTSNVGSLTESWTHAFGTGNGSEIPGAVTEANNVVYATTLASDFAKGSGFIGGGTLAAFSATACPQSPTNCAPLWTAPVEYGLAPMIETPVVANNEVYVNNGPWLAAFPTDNSSCPLVSGYCTPLRIYDNAGASAVSPPLVVNNLLYAPGSGKVFSADGTQGCSLKSGVNWLGVPILECEPLWTNVASSGSSFTNGGTPTVVTASAGSYNGDPILYLAAPTSGGLLRVFAYDANDKNNCGVVYGLPVCAPLWTDQATGQFSDDGAGAVSVANGYAYVGGSNLVGSGGGQGTLFAFDQNGVGCASGICSPKFETSGGPGFPVPINLAVSGSTVYGTTAGGILAAFSATGTGTLWKTGPICADAYSNSYNNGAPNVANGVVYVGITCGSPPGVGTGGGVAAYSTSGTLIKSYPSPDNGAVYNSPIVANNGVLYFGTISGSIYAYAP
jgi:hypothetical protein